MFRAFSKVALYATLTFGQLGTVAFAQDDMPSPPKPKPSGNPNEEIIEYKNEAVEGWTMPKEFSAKEIADECKKYEGKAIGYYGTLYMVEKCKLREVQVEESINKLNSSGNKIPVVQPDTVAKLGIGEPLTGNKTTNAPKRTCKELNNRYISYSHIEIFFVENCKKRLFPDWETYSAHKNQGSRAKDPILVVDWFEFRSLAAGTVMSSVVDSEYSKILKGEAGIDVIPIHEACKGLNGRDVSFIDQIYRIENCKKRVYDIEKFMMLNRFKEYKLKELSAEQWLSLPNGKAMELD